METEFSLKISNASKKGWYLAVYQNHPGLPPIAWRVLSLSPSSQSHPTVGVLSWTTTYQLTVPQRQHENKYIGEISVDAKAGFNYELVTEAGYLQIYSTGEGTAGCINFKNSTMKEQNIGLSLSGNLVAMKQKVNAEETVQFQTVPSFYVGVYSHLKQEMFIPSDSAIKPVKIEFPKKKASASVEVLVKDSEITIHGPNYLKFKEKDSN